MRYSFYLATTARRSLPLKNVDSRPIDFYGRKRRPAVVQPKKLLSHFVAHRVSRSSRVKNVIAWDRVASMFSSVPHISADARRLLHTNGRSGSPKILQRFSSSSCTQRCPANFPCGAPGIGEEIEGAIQHAPQPERQFMPPRAPRSLRAVWRVASRRAPDAIARAMPRDRAAREVRPCSPSRQVCKSDARWL